MKYPASTKALLLAILTQFSVHAQQLETTTPVRAKTNGEAWWNGNYENINKDIKALGPDIDLCFVGDSITARWRGKENNWSKYWGEYKAANLGIGGDGTQHVLWRLQNGQLDGYKAKIFVVLIGTNNLWGKDSKPADAAAGVKVILDEIQKKQPQAKILLLSLLPVGEKPNPGRDSRAAVNEIIKKYANESIIYMDIATQFLQPDNTISKDDMHDFLHLSPKGYEMWAKAITPKIKEILSK